MPIGVTDHLRGVAINTALMRLSRNIYERTGIHWAIARPTKIADAESEWLPLGLVIWPQKIVQILACIVGALFCADLTIQVVDAVLKPNFAGWGYVSRVFDLNEERSFGTWYGIASLLFLSALLSVVAYTKHHTKDRFWRHWLVLSLLSLAFSIDEQTGFHDPRAGTTNVRETFGVHFGLHGPLYYGWVVIGLLSVVVVALLYRHFIASLPPTIRQLFMLAAGVYVAGKIGIEMVSGWYVDAAGADDLIFHVLTAFEELLAMAGILIGIGAVLHYIQLSHGELRIALNGSDAVHVLGFQKPSTTPLSAGTQDVVEPCREQEMEIGDDGTGYAARSADA